MQPEELQHLIEEGESATLELKKSTAQLKAAVETLCAFLNTDGGTVLIGVTDGRKIVGQEVSDKTKREIGNELVKIHPFPTIEVSYISLPITGKFIIVLHAISDSTKKPYLFDGRAFIRVQSDTLLMPREHLHQLTANNVNKSWEDKSFTKVNIDDLDTIEILNTLQEGVINGRIPESYNTQNPLLALKRLGLVIDEKITNAAIVLFAKNPELYFPQCLLRLARFRGADKSDFIDSRQITGNIFTIVKEVMTFANIYLPVSSIFSEDSIQRTDIPFFPILALRESIANAVCHRDYIYHGGSISFAIYDNRIEIWNYGLLPLGISVDSLKDLNQSVPRNRRIANVLYYRKILESWGRGVQMIITECKKANHPEPFYSQEGGGTKLTLPFYQAIGNISLQAINVKETAFDDLSKRQREILNLLKEHKFLSPEDLRIAMKNSLPERTLRDELNRLKKLNLIDFIGQTRARKWYLIK